MAPLAAPARQRPARPLRAVVLLAAIAAPATAAAAADTRSTDEVYAEIVKMERLTQTCTRRQPDLTSLLAGQRARWEADNADAHREARAAVAALRAQAGSDVDARERGMVADFDSLFEAGSKMFGEEAFCRGMYDHITTQSGGKPMTVVRAAGIFIEQSLFVDAVTQGCGSRFPQMAGDIATTRSAWNRREAPLVRGLDRFVRSVPADQAVRIESQREAIRAHTRDTVGRALAQADGEAYCRANLDDFASGAWRRDKPGAVERLSNDQAAN